MKTVPLADVLWRAANYCLSPQQSGDLEFSHLPDRFLTCNAIAKALRREWWWMNLPDGVKTFLGSLGCPVSSGNAFVHVERGEERQGVRYMWLLLAMHVAEDENIMVKVA